MTSDATSFDIFELFGSTIETFSTRQKSVVELIWGSQIDKADFEEGEGTLFVSKHPLPIS